MFLIFFSPQNNAYLGQRLFPRRKKFGGLAVKKKEFEWFPI